MYICTRIKYIYAGKVIMISRQKHNKQCTYSGDVNVAYKNPSFCNFIGLHVKISNALRTTIKYKKYTKIKYVEMNDFQSGLRL